jgi:hypothetical protein
MGGVRFALAFSSIQYSHRPAILAPLLGNVCRAAANRLVILKENAEDTAKERPRLLWGLAFGLSMYAVANAVFAEQ